MSDVNRAEGQAETITLSVDLVVAVGAADDLRSAAFHAMRQAAPGEDGIAQAVTSGEDTAAALGAYLAAVPQALMLNAPGVAGWHVTQVRASRPMTARERLEQQAQQDKQGQEPPAEA